MSEMIERVAMAMRARRFERTGRTSTVQKMDPPTENELDDARAAIQAMREPANDMCNAGTRCLALDWEISCDGRIAPDVWSKMIDEALK